MPAKGNGLLKKGKELPLDAKRQEFARGYALAVAEALTEELRRGGVDQDDHKLDRGR